MSILITALDHKDRARWEQLFVEYCDFYGFDCSPTKRDTVWQWLFDLHHPLTAIAARDSDQQLVGFAHYQTMPLSLFGTETGYLADLYVDKAYRRQGIATQLHRAFIEHASQKGWSFVAWLTQEGNTQARSLYDKTAQMTDLRYYVQQIQSNLS